MRAAFREAVLWLGKQRMTEIMHAAPPSRRARAQSNNWSCGRSHAAPCAPRSQVCIRCAYDAKVARGASSYPSFLCLSAHYIQTSLHYGGNLLSRRVRPAGRQRAPALVITRVCIGTNGSQRARIAGVSKPFRFHRRHSPSVSKPPRQRRHV